MDPLEDSRMGDERTAIDLQRKKPSWRGTKAVEGISTKRQLLRRTELSLLVAVAGLIALIPLIGWLLHVS